MTRQTAETGDSDYKYVFISQISYCGGMTVAPDNFQECKSMQHEEIEVLEV